MKQILSVIILSTLLFSCKEIDKKFNLKSGKTYEESKQNLADKEKENPKQFLKLTGDDHRNFWGKTVYKGLIKNTATVISYKDVRVKLLYFKEGAQVANHEELFDNTISPNDDFSFKAKYKTPRGTDSVAAYIMSATAVE